MQRFPRCLLALTFPLHSPSHFPPISQNSNSQELTLFCGFGAQVTSVTLTAFKIKSKLLSLTYKALNHPALAYLLSCNSLKHTPSCGIFLLLYLLYVFLEDYPTSPSGPTYSLICKTHLKSDVLWKPLPISHFGLSAVPLCFRASQLT